MITLEVSDLDFKTVFYGDVLVERVQMLRATKREAEFFNKKLNSHIEKKLNKIVIDLSQCEFLDSSFLGALVFNLKYIERAGGEIKLVEPANTYQGLLEKTGTFRIFNTYKSIKDAVESFRYN
ncbi:MAG: STAS domain-containing protein [Ignavibacteriales bacterium]|nr:STAS domain-containing protein [Ignavibacteriales bacterium]